MKDMTKHISNLKHTNRDIAETVAAKTRKITANCLLWTAAVSLAEALWLHEYFTARINAVSSVIIWIALCSIPFIGYKVWQLVLDKTWIGTVTSLKYDREVNPTPTGSRKITYKNVLEMTVDCGDRVKVVKLPCATAQALYPYEVGDIVCRYRGTKYPVFAVASKTGAQLCPICGTIHKPHELECFWCHHSAIKPSKRNSD